MKRKLKICGLMRPEDVNLCCRARVDICGFVTEYPLAVPWNLTREQCVGLLPYVASPTKSCIVTGGRREHILELALTLQPDYVQLHFKERIADVKFLVRELSHRGIQVIKTIPLSEEERLEQFGTQDVKECVKMLSDVGVSIILVDSRGPSNAVTGGTTTDFALCDKIRETATCPVMLGGGITAENVQEIMDRTQSDFIDVMTGVEISPGVKSEEKVWELMRAMECYF